MSKTRDTGYLANVIQVHDTGVRIMSGSTMLMAISSSGAVTITGEMSGSDAANALLLEGTGSLGFADIDSFLAVSSSQQQISASLLNVVATSATTGSNTFTGAQFVSDTSNGIGFTSTASFYTDGGLRVGKNAYVSGTAYFNNIVVFGTSSIQYITSSQVNIGANIITVNTDTPAVRFGGLSVFDSGSTQLTGSIFWDSEKNHWVYSNPSGSTYSGGMFISGPRSSALGCEQGTTACMLLVGQGGDHLTSSMIYHDSVRTCFPTTLIGTGQICGAMGNFSCLGIGTVIPTGSLDIRNAIQPNKQIILNTACGFGSYATLYTDSEAFYSWTNSSACANNKAWRMGTPTNNPNILSIQNMTDSGTSICGTPLSISACGRVTVCSILGATSIDLNPVAACPSNAGVGYGMFGYSGVGLALSSGGTGANQGIAFFTCGDFERMRLISSGNLGIGTICPSSRLTVAGNVGIGSNIGSSTYTGPSQYGAITFPRAQILFSNTNAQNQFYFISNGVLNSSSQYIYTCNGPAGGMIYDNGSLSLSIVDCGASGCVITFRTGVGVTSGGHVNVGPTLTIGNQGGTDTTVIGGGSGIGSTLRMNYAGGSYNNYLAGNGDNYFNCLLGKLNAAGGVKFGGGATTLNNYEQGSWTPELQNASVSYSYRSGTYVRIGDYVFVRWGFRISSISGQSGTVTISGLPFTSVSWGSYQEPNISVSTGALATADNAQRARVFVGGSSTSLSGRIANNADTTWNTSDLQNGSWIIGEIFYNVP